MTVDDNASFARTASLHRKATQQIKLYVGVTEIQQIFTSTEMAKTERFLLSLKEKVEKL